MVVSLGVFLFLTVAIDRGILKLTYIFYKTTPGALKALDRISGLAIGVAKNGFSVLVTLAVLKPLLTIGAVGGKATLITFLSHRVSTSELAPYFFNFLSSLNI
ncbi:MAG: hypothetical protein M0Z31_13310 [Clostridia bacterium]|nr:hypothetical protein [Clostridia bacterium]